MGSGILLLLTVGIELAPEGECRRMVNWWMGRWERKHEAQGTGRKGSMAVHGCKHPGTRLVGSTSIRNTRRHSSDRL